MDVGDWKNNFFVANDLNVRAGQHAWSVWKGRMLASHCLCIVDKLIKLQCPSPVMLADMRALKAFCQTITSETNSYNYCIQAFSCVRTEFCVYQKLSSQFSFFKLYLYTNIQNHEKNSDLLKSLELALLLLISENSEFSVC